jgi:hypothetical protein
MTKKGTGTGGPRRDKGGSGGAVRPPSPPPPPPGDPSHVLAAQPDWLARGLAVALFGAVVVLIIALISARYDASNARTDAGQWESKAGAWERENKALSKRNDDLTAAYDRANKRAEDCAAFSPVLQAFGPTFTSYQKFTIDKARGGEGHLGCSSGGGDCVDVTIAPVKESTDPVLELTYDAYDPVSNNTLRGHRSDIPLIEGKHSGLTTRIGHVVIVIEKVNYATVTVGMAVLPGEPRMRVQ